MTTKLPITLRKFQGLNTRSDSSEIEDLELAECINFDLTLAGSLRGRKGLDNVLSATGEVRLLGSFRLGADHYIIFVDDTGVRYTDDLVTSTLISAAPTDPRFGVQYVDTFYIMDATDGIHSWDGTTFTTIPSTPTGTFGIVHKERLFTFDHTDTEESRLYFSEPGDFTDFPAVNFIDVSPGDGDFLTCASVLYDLLILFKGNRTYSLAVQGSSEADWVLREIEASLGCTSAYGAAVVDGGLFFISTKGVYRTDGTTFREATTPIANQFNDRVLNSTTVDLDYLVRFEDKLIASLKRPSDRKTYVFHLKVGGWTEWSFVEVLFNPVSITTGTIGVGLYFGGDGNIFRQQEELYQDNSLDITCSFATKSLSFEKPTEFKRGFWVGLDAFLSEDSVFTSYIDDGNRVQESNILSDVNRNVYKLEGPGYFRHWQAKLTAYNQVEIHGLTLIAGVKNKVHSNVR